MSWPGKHHGTISFICGALTPLALAPFNYWPIALLTLSCFFISFNSLQKTRQAFFSSWLFGNGLFIAGASWVYVSIHDHGYAPVPLAVFLTGLFVIGLGLVFSIPFTLYHKYLRSQPLSLLLGLPCIWVLGEWLRSWLLTGFPWLFIGYSQVEGPLAGWFPIGGVFTVSLIIAFSASALAHTVKYKSFYTLAAAATLFVLSPLLSEIKWTTEKNQAPLSTSILQPNFSLQEKWDPRNRLMIRDTLLSMTDPHWSQDIILWPEAAIPELQYSAQDFLSELSDKAKSQGSTLILGIPSFNSTNGKYHNSIIALGTGQGSYHKVKLVPFGEYVPLEDLLRGLIAFFDLPMSNFSKGLSQQDGLQSENLKLYSFICYEIVYPDFVAKRSRDTDFLITVSNDSWFGESIGPLQHLQMAQARALETGRYLLRGTNNGVSAIITPKGKIQKRSTQFEREILTGTFHTVSGNTPFSAYGSNPVLFIMFAVIVFLLIGRNKSKIRF